MPFIPKPKQDSEGFPDFNTDFFALLRNLIPDSIPTAWPRYRRGGSPRNWATPGGNKYTDPSGFVQLGCERRSYDPSVTEGIEDFIFPVAFSGTPIIFVNPGEIEDVNVFTSCHIYALEKWQFTVQWWSSQPLYWLNINWLAFGPGAG